jgi:hypothetical protein
MAETEDDRYGSEAKVDAFPAADARKVRQGSDTARPRLIQT